MRQVEHLTEYGQVVGPERLSISPLGAFLVESAGRDAIPGIFALAMVCPDRSADSSEPDLMVGLVVFLHAPPFICVGKDSSMGEFPCLSLSIQVECSIKKPLNWCESI